jgi:hypothetical protein
MSLLETGRAFGFCCTHKYNPALTVPAATDGKHFVILACDAMIDVTSHKAAIA